MMVAVALLACGVPAHAEHVLGIVGVPVGGGVGGVVITKVVPNSNAVLLGLEVNDVIFALGNPAGGADLAIPANDTDIGNMMLSCGDFLVMVVLKSKSPAHLDVTQSALTADKVVSAPLGDDTSPEATIPVATSKGKQKVTGKTVREVLKNQDQPDRKGVKVTGNVTHLKLHKAAFDNVNAKDKGKDKGTSKGTDKGKKSGKSGSSGKKLEVSDLLEDIAF